MNDIEDDLRALLQDKASETGPPSPVPPRVLKRGRRRQVANVAASTVALIAVVLVSVVGVRGMLRADKTGVAGQPSPAPSSNAQPDPSPLPSQSPTLLDRNVQSDLRNALVAAKTYYTDGATYLGFTPKIASSIEPSLSFNDALTADVGEVNIRAVSASTVLLVEKSKSGAVYCIADDASVGTTYGAENALTLADCSGGPDAWGIGAPQSSPEPTTDAQMQSELRNGFVAALTFFTDSNTFVGFGPQEATFITGHHLGVVYNTSPSAVMNEISIRDVGQNTILLVGETSTGNIWCIAQDHAADTTTYGIVDAQTIADCSDRSWPAAAPTNAP